MGKETSLTMETELRNSNTKRVITREEVAKHNTEESSWIIINNSVYDITTFASLHPGGEQILRQQAGKDVTDLFYDLHRHDVIKKYQKYCIGKLADSNNEEFISAEDGLISTVPYSEVSPWRDGWSSPYYKESHVEYRKNLRKWLLENVRDECLEFSSSDKVPSLELNKKIGQSGLYGARLGPGKHLHGRSILGVKGEEFDAFHQLITHEEWSRICGYPAVQDGLGTGLVIGLPPVYHFGHGELRERVVRECLEGSKRICLAISEPTAGSDVANIQTTAVKSECGKYYIVSGIKKWITNGTFADYFVTAVRTGGKSIDGVSLLLIERSEGVETKPMKTTYGSSAGTAYIIFENVKVPIQNILGEENGGFRCIMANFNHERWFIVCLMTATARIVIEECFKWSMQRKVFGKRLIDQPVVRQKFAMMIAESESLQYWLEHLTYQMSVMPIEDQFFQLGGPIALLKMYSTRVTYAINDHACQIFGGRAITATGMGKYIEQFQKSIKYGAILGGAEEIMGDLAVRLATRSFPQNSKL